LQPDGHQIVGKVTWSIIDDESGVIQLPKINDLVLIGLVDGDEEQAYIVDRCSSIEERIAIEALDGSLVLKASKGSKTRVLSDTKILLQKGSFGTSSAPADAISPVVLGDVLKDFLDQFINMLLNAPQIGICGVGSVQLDPGLVSQLNTLKSQFVDTASTNILSQIVFTERGS